MQENHFLDILLEIHVEQREQQEGQWGECISRDCTLCLPKVHRGTGCFSYLYDHGILFWELLGRHRMPLEELFSVGLHPCID